MYRSASSIDLCIVSTITCYRYEYSSRQQCRAADEQAAFKAVAHILQLSYWSSGCEQTARPSPMLENALRMVLLSIKSEMVLGTYLNGKESENKVRV